MEIKTYKCDKCGKKGKYDWSHIWDIKIKNKRFVIKLEMDVYEIITLKRGNRKYYYKPSQKGNVCKDCIKTIIKEMLKIKRR